jgi:hypothetical protein
MPRSRNRYSRAALRSRYRKPRRRRGGTAAWNTAIVAVVVAGLAAVFLVRSSNSAASSGPPRVANQAANRPGDHWHAYLGVDICGVWLGNAPAFETAADNPKGPNVGIHSHGDGLIHVHPFVSSEAGAQATLGKFLTYGGWSASSDSLHMWSGPTGAESDTSWSDGDKCTVGDFKGKRGTVQWAVNGKAQSGNPSDVKLKDGQVITLAFLPATVKPPLPPLACSALANIGDIATSASFDPESPCVKGSTSSAPDAGSTTSPASTPASTAAP